MQYNYKLLTGEHYTELFPVAIYCGDKEIMRVQSENLANTLTATLNQEYAMWIKQENERIAELQAALATCIMTLKGTFYTGRTTDVQAVIDQVEKVYYKK
jgi:hypothetical protein